MEAPLTTAGNYELGRVLGAGSTGKVKLGRHRKTGELVAVKIIKKERLHADTELYRKVRREIAVMKLVRHPNVLELYDVYESDHHLLLILEYAAEGELFDRLVDRGYMREDKALALFQQVIEALSYCHRRGICHRDLKAENILIAEDESIRLADFGFCSLVDSGSTLDTGCGSLSYLAPEILDGDPYCGRSADIWSCGILLFVLVTGGFPMDCRSIQEQILTLRSWGKHIPSVSLPSELSPECRELLKLMLTIDPSSRITLNDIKKSRWYNLKSVSQTHEDDGFMVVDRPPVCTPDMDIVRQLVDIGCGDVGTILRRLRGKRRCLEREFYSFLQEHEDRVSKSKRVRVRPPLTPKIQSSSRLLIFNVQNDQLLPPSISTECPEAEVDSFSSANTTVTT